MAENKRSLEERLIDLAGRLERVEKLLLKETGSVEDLQQELRTLRGVVSAVGSFVGLASSLRNAAQNQNYGDIERHILETLHKAGKPLNISQITREVKAERGTASRRIIAKKLSAMQEKELVKMDEGIRGEKLYSPNSANTY
ncbi:MAG: hypothetical protein FJ358_07050 [Thaumarchaeota archaeon]|nr:hypothetical protein [Nitrososphaerota archaeon]